MASHQGASVEEFSGPARQTSEGDMSRCGGAYMENILEEPYQHIAQIPGKEIRTLLIDAFDQWMNIPKDKVALIKEVTKILHNASLL